MCIIYNPYPSPKLYMMPTNGHIPEMYSQHTIAIRTIGEYVK